MHPGKLDRGLVRRDWSAIITERIKRGGRADELRRCRIKDRIGLVHDAVESRGGHLLSGNRVLELTVAPPGVVPPSPVKQLVTSYANRTEPRVGFVIEQTVPKFGQTRTSATRYDLLERVKRIECIRRKTGLRVGGRVGWLRAWRNWRVGRSGQCGLSSGLE